MVLGVSIGMLLICGKYEVHTRICSTVVGNVDIAARLTLLSVNRLYPQIMLLLTPDTARQAELAQLKHVHAGPTIGPRFTSLNRHCSLN